MDKAFLPFRRREDGKILPSYQWKECERRIIVCVKWSKKIIWFENYEYFLEGDYGVVKRPKP